MRKALALTIRLERQQVAECRQALAVIDAAIAACERAAATAQAELDRGLVEMWAMPGGPRLVAAYITRLRHELVETARRRKTLEAHRTTALAALNERLAAAKSLEAAEEHLGRLAAKEEAQRDAAIADESAMLRHAYTTG